VLSVSARGSAAEAADYYAHLAADHDGRPEDYYAREGAGQWAGAAAALNLIGAVDPKSFQRVLEGRALDGQDLVQGAGNCHRAGWDCTFSAPKSVSAVWAIADHDQRALIQAAHDQAVAKAVEQIQALCVQARVGSSAKGTLRRESATAVVATFCHGTSRALDPALHSHAFIANLAQREDGSWGGIESREIYRWKMALGAAYRAEMAAGLTKAGLAVEADGDSFKLAGVPDELCADWSTRRQQIVQALADHGASGAKASEVAALDTRRAKDVDQDREQLHARWTGEALEQGFTADQAFAAKATVAPEPMPTPEELLRRATEHDAVIEERHVWQTVAVACQHRGEGIDTIQERVAEVLESPALVRLVHPETGETKFTTRELYEQERQVLEYARKHAADLHLAVDAATVDAALASFAKVQGFVLSDEQVAAVHHVTEQPGAVRTIVGDAGTGKSTAMKAARMAWENNGQRVIGCAISGKAAAGLQDGAGIESHTIASLLMRLEPQTNEASGETWPPRETLTDRDVIVVDEAGMVDSRTMHRLAEHAQAAQARVVLVGDHKQLQSVGAGGVFRHLADQDSARISEIRRQREDWAKTAVQRFSLGEAVEALGAFVDRGLVHVTDDQAAAVDLAVDRWAHHAAEVGVAETLLMANTNAEVARLNQAARAARAGELGHEVTIQTCNRDGRPTGTLAVAEGDRLLAKRNDRETGLKNGDLMTVDSITYTSRGVEIEATIDRTGRSVAVNPDEYAQLRHGYAVTTHAAQGATVDRAVVLGGGSMTSRESTYVQMSRMRETAEFIATRQQIRNAASALDVEQEQVAPDPLAQLRDVVKAMSQSRQKETTLDYLAAHEHQPEAARRGQDTEAHKVDEQKTHQGKREHIPEAEQELGL